MGEKKSLYEGVIFGFYSYLITRDSTEPNKTGEV